MSEVFKTVLKLGQAEIVEKKSRFIATVKPVKTEEEAREFIEETKKKYWDARHNVFAYVIGEKNEIQRFSDDGEPQGTAGMPVLSVLTGENIKNCCIVVTRYFGGTLLGTGGLVRAYGKSAKEGLLDAEVVEIEGFTEFSVICDYSLQGKIQYEIIKLEEKIKETVFTDKVEFIIYVREKNEKTFETKIIDASSANVKISVLRKFKGAMIAGEIKETE